MNCETGPKAGPEILAAQRRNHSQTTTTASHKLALARAGALVIVTSATANGTFEPTPQVLNATASLAASLAFDLWVVGA